MSSSARGSGTKANNYCQCAIDLADLAKREQPMGFAKPARIDGTELFHQNPCTLTVDFNLRSERSRMGSR